MDGRDRADELHDNDRLAHAGPAEDACLAAAREGGDEINYFQTRFENLYGCGLLLEWGRRLVDGLVFRCLDRPSLVDRLP